MSDRPWASAVDRLLKRRGVKPTELVAYGLKRPGTISDLRNSPKRPDVATLQHVAEVLTKYDRRGDGGNAQAPAVAVWEFFVSDDQADLLHRQAAHAAELVKPAAPDPRREMVERFLDFMDTPAGQQMAVEMRKRKSR